MTSISSQLLSIILPFFVTVCMVMVLRHYAENLDLLDTPTDRKQHLGNIPLVGGLAMFIAFAFSLLLLSPSLNSLTLIFISAVIVMLGALDDRHGLQTRKRFLIQLPAAVAMVYFGGLQLTYLGNLFGDGAVVLTGFFSLVFTIFCVVGVINAMNMMDGLDGLAGGVSLMSFIALAVVAYLSGETQVLLILSVIIGALIGFLLFNVQLFGVSARIFMGDAGSMLIGFLMAWLFIQLTQDTSGSLSAVAAGWMFGVPLLDTFVVMIRRVLHRKSPFQAGRDHIHHLLLAKGLSEKQTVCVIISAQIVFIAGGFLANAHVYWEPVMFWFFVIIVLFHLFISHEKVNLSSSKAHI